VLVGVSLTAFVVARIAQSDLEPVRGRKPDVELVARTHEPSLPARPSHHVRRGEAPGHFESTEHWSPVSSASASSMAVNW
jgi:hypothetical protein